jgi:hypothetical protein
VYRAWQRERQCDVSTELHECRSHVSQHRRKPCPYKSAELIQGAKRGRRGAGGSESARRHLISPTDCPTSRRLPSTHQVA